MSEERDAIFRKINETLVAMKHTGPIHQKDLQRHIVRLMKQLNRHPAKSLQRADERGSKND